MTIVTQRVEYVSDIDWVKLSSSVDQLLIKNLQEQLKHWHDDLSMRQMFVQDCADGLAVCELLAEGRWEAAENRLWDMDTAARDVVYDAIETVAGAEFFDIVRAK